MTSRLTFATRAMIALGATTMTIGLSGAALAAGSQTDRVVTFKIAAQPLSSALVAYGRQSDQQVLFPPELVDGKTAPVLNASMNVMAALDTLLKGSGLSYSRTKGGAILITAPSQSAAGSDIGPVNDESSLAETSSDDAIIVTARRREERLQDVPLSVVALSQDALTEANVASLADVPKLAAGLVYQPSTFGSRVISFTIRGQRQNFPNITYDPSVVPYFAEVPIMRMTGANAALYDLASVQVLKGPQGTLFGRNATGGAVLITPKAPEPDFGGYVKAGIGNYGLREIEGAVNVPGGDFARVRLSARHVRRDGYEKVIGKDYSVNDDELDAVRFSLTLEPGAGIKNDLVVDYSRQKGSGTGWVILNCFPSGRANTISNGGYCADYDRQQNHPFHSTTSNVDPDHGSDIKVTALSNITSLDVGGVTFKNIFGYRKLNSFVSFDIDGSSLDLLNSSDRMDVDQISEELQVLGKTLNDRLDFQLGAFFFREQGDEVQQTPVFGNISRVDVTAKNRSMSVYGQATYEIPWVDGLSLTAGLRQNYDRREMINRGRSISSTVDTCRILDANIGGVPIDPCEKDVSAKFNSLTYNFSLSWKIDRDLMIYAAARKGYRSGGFSHAARTPAEFQPYRPETVNDYEIGLKSDYRIGGVSGRTNAAAYIGKYDDIQRNILVTGLIDPLTGGFYTQSTTINAASATIKGIEVEQMLRPFRFLELNLSYAYVDAGYDKFLLPDGKDYSGAPFAGTPKHTLSGSARLEIPMADTVGEVSFQLSGAYRSSSVEVDLSSFNLVTGTTSPYGIVPGYTTYDARIDWDDVLGSALRLSAWVRNLTNKNYVTAISDASSIGLFTGVLGVPRTYGLEARYDF